MLIASCAGTDANTRLDLRENSYVLAENIPGAGMCYTRFIRSVPTDQVCHHRSQVRYSPEPHLSHLAGNPIPPYVLALFETMPKPQ